MKALIINGSPRENGNTEVAIREIVETSKKQKSILIESMAIFRK